MASIKGTNLRLKVVIEKKQKKEEIIKKQKAEAIIVKRYRDKGRISLSIEDEQNNNSDTIDGDTDLNQANNENSFPDHNDY